MISDDCGASYYRSASWRCGRSISTPRLFAKDKIMLKRFVLAAVAVAALATGAQAGGPTAQRERYAEPGQGWMVDYFPGDNSCGLARMHTNDVALQILYNPSSDTFSLMLQNNKWTKIEDRAAYKLRLVMDGGADRWNGDARGLWLNNGSPSLVVPGLSMEFIRSFMRRNRVDIYNAANGNWITALALDGTAAGMMSLIECLDAHDSVKRSAPAPAPKPQQQQKRPEFQS
jgi:hypothetical protein